MHAIARKFVDPRTRELAEHFLRADAITGRVTGRDIESLAGEIQDAIEGWFESRGTRLPYEAPRLERRDPNRKPWP